ncbi:hypothetical protein LZZ85_01785 [Terrimonas sp. NA20]|uniref:DUF4488 domain-containing protein n=1 Tax=Terrimonas ginsenosidimutans TaxID=2908004 RepID=A0ABS9KKX8_9BACT|nr:hypothetical protein [Terrimonas ginsenosidimutans]MCG2612983.1 hypothetical protein [Terrimonas ginsenosidimutans]
MKTLRYLLLFLLLPAASQAQQSLTGLWTGTLSNDSSTVRKDQSFELALTEYRGKVYGYTRTAFVVRDTLFYTIKRVKGIVADGVCEVKDDEVISTNFPGRQDKGVKVSYIFRQRLEDTTWHLDGNWKTNKTKTFYSISGGVALRSEKNLDNSKIFPHLQELGKSDDVAFYRESKETKPSVAKNNPEKTPSPARLEESVKPPVKKQEKAIAKTEKAENKINKDLSRTESAPANGTIPPPTAPALPAAFVKERKNSVPKVVTFKSDSLVLALYDNGEVDGDTVSLLLNGEVIIAKQMLKASALKKTIYLPADQEETTLLLYAENLGKFPPNTGLLVIHDGEETYQLHFSADLQTNASVIFRRKKK